MNAAFPRKESPPQQKNLFLEFHSRQTRCYRAFCHDQPNQPPEGNHSGVQPWVHLEVTSRPDPPSTHSTRDRTTTAGSPGVPDSLDHKREVKTARRRACGPRTTCTDPTNQPRLCSVPTSPDLFKQPKAGPGLWPASRPAALRPEHNHKCNLIQLPPLRECFNFPQKSLEKPPKCTGN